MDATALRWVLGIIGVICIVGVYLYSVYQNRRRQQAAIKTFTHDDVESGFIEDADLRQELSNINAMLDADISAQDVDDIKINASADEYGADEYGADETIIDEKIEPELDPEPLAQTPVSANTAELPHAVCQLMPDHRIAHVLKADNLQALSLQAISDAMAEAGFSLNESGFYCLPNDPLAQFQLLNMTASGSFVEPAGQGQADGLVCCINLEKCQHPLECYELMLKKVDELVRLLDLKVFDQNEELLTLQHVTDIRNKLIAENGMARDQKVEP